MFFVIPLFLSCGEEDEITYYNTYIDGYITDYNTGEPVQGIAFDINYNYDWSGTWGQGSLYVKNAIITDNRGYYKINIPKTINDRAAVGLDLRPNETQDYGFQTKYLFIKDENLDVKSKRINITPISYEYLKVIVPIRDEVLIRPYSGSYEAPMRPPRHLSTDTINNSKVILYSVPATNGAFRHLSNNGTQGPEYTFVVNMPKDTVTIDLTK